MITLLIGFVVGFATGFLLFKNNAEKAGKIADLISSVFKK
jgi:hypothetical protein